MVVGDKGGRALADALGKGTRKLIGAIARFEKGKPNDGLRQDYGALVKKYPDSKLDALPEGLFDDFIDQPEVVEKFLKGDLDIDAWKVLSDLPDSKKWVRTNVNLLQRLTNKPDYDWNEVAEFFRKSVKRACKPVPCDFVTPGGAVRISEFGFPDFTGHCIGGAKYYYKGPISGNRTTDFAEATSWLTKQNGIKKVTGNRSPIEAQ